MIALRIHDGKLAIWTKPLVGDPMAPFDDPATNIDAVKFHSDMQVLSALTIDDVTVSHASVAGATGTGQIGAPQEPGSSGGNTGSTQAIANGLYTPANHTLVTHSLGYVPFHAVIFDGEIVSGATVVQAQSGGRSRRVSSYATTSIIGLREIGVSGTSALSSASIDYQVIVFRDVAPDMGKPLFHVRLADGTIVLGHGKIDDTMPVVRRAADGVEPTFYVPLGKTVDIKNGAVRSASPNNGVTDTGVYTGTMYQIEVIPVTFDGFV